MSAGVCEDMYTENVAQTCATAGTVRHSSLQAWALGHVNTHVSMHVCTHVYTHACTHVCTHIFLHTCLYTCLYTFLHACPDICLRACLHACYTHVYTHVYTIACAHVHVFNPHCGYSSLSLDTSSPSPIRRPGVRTSGTHTGMFDGMFDGTLDGMFGRPGVWTSVTHTGMFDGMFDGTFDGMFGRPGVWTSVAHTVRDQYPQSAICKVYAHKSVHHRRGTPSEFGVVAATD